MAKSAALAPRRPPPAEPHQRIVAQPVVVAAEIIAFGEAGAATTCPGRSRHWPGRAASQSWGTADPPRWQAANPRSAGRRTAKVQLTNSARSAPSQLGTNPARCAGGWCPRRAAPQDGRAAVRPGAAGARARPRASANMTEVRNGHGAAMARRPGVDLVVKGQRVRDAASGGSWSGLDGGSGAILLLVGNGAGPEPGRSSRGWQLSSRPPPVLAVAAPRPNARPGHLQRVRPWRRRGGSWPRCSVTSNRHSLPPPLLAQRDEARTLRLRGCGTDVHDAPDAARVVAASPPPRSPRKTRLLHIVGHQQHCGCVLPRQIRCCISFCRRERVRASSAPDGSSSSSTRGRLTSAARDGHALRPCRPRSDAASDSIEVLQAHQLDVLGAPRTALAAARDSAVNVAQAHGNVLLDR